MWQSIDTLTRPDGSIAQSTILMRDGTAIRSSFNGSLVVNTVTLPDGRVVRVERRDGVQWVYVGDSGTPAVLSAWTPNGPRIAVPRKRVAFSGSIDLLPHTIEPDSTIVGGYRPNRDIEIIDPNPMASSLDASGIAIGTALLTLYMASQADRASLGAGADDKPALTIRVWGPSGKLTPVPVSVTSLTAEQVAQNCKRLPEVQQWTDEAALALASQRPSMSAQDYGTQLHLRIKMKILALKDLLPGVYADTFAEQSFDREGLDTRYGTPGSSRLDVVERREDVVCIYDVKTGKKGITADQLERAMMIAVRFGKLTFYIVQVNPSQ